MKQYTITLSEKQAEQIQEACELAGRLSMGQMDYMIEFLASWDRTQWAGCKNPGTKIDVIQVEAICRMLKQALTGYDYGSYGSIAGQPENIKIMWDIRDTIRHKLSWDRHTPGDPTWTVNYDTPFHLSKEPLPKVEQK